MSIVTVTRDYKITIPKDVREVMHLLPGQKIVLIPNGAGIQMIPKFSAEDLKSAVTAGLVGQGYPADEVFDRLEKKYSKLAAESQKKVRPS